MKKTEQMAEFIDTWRTLNACKTKMVALNDVVAQQLKAPGKYLVGDVVLTMDSAGNVGIIEVTI